ncbi:GNAT family N-acetyltransferase [Poseidonocella sp. HB161398]|uniref:GNAT family N-acetyltransferase n=1 Tax=Poseidonocella sp. HB161398 TaxID=2320855 RepID=UPI0011088FEA|nr:GNAT family N-acetyltransferase [Poseidonocella sp. HB161398]
MDWTELPSLPGLAAAPMQQHPAYGRACALAGAGTAWLGLGPASRPRATAQVLFRRWPLIGRVALVPRGPVWAEPPCPEEAAAALAGLAAWLRRDCRAAVLSPDCLGGADPAASAGLLPLMTGGTQARLRLDGSPAERMARMHGKWRNRLRRAQEAGLELSQGPLPADPGHWLLRREAEQARRRRYRHLPAGFLQAWRLENGPRAARVFAASLGGVPVAGMLFLVHGCTATYHLGWSGSAGRATGAHALLLWEAAGWLARRGCRWAELGLLDTHRTPGLARFKLGAGAEPVALGSSWIDAPGSRACARFFGHGRPPGAAPKAAAMGPHHPA